MNSHSALKPLSIRVVEAIAATSRTDPLDLEPPLFDSINPEALDLLFREDVDCVVTFDYEGHSIEVRSDGTITVDETVYEQS